MLDTNICIFSIKNTYPKLNEKIVSFSKKDISLSTIVVSELYYGVKKSKSKKNLERLTLFLSCFNIIDFNITAAEIYGSIRSNLEVKGKTIGPYDLQIASQALADKAILVTNNTKEFSRIPKLKTEDWTKL